MTTTVRVTGISSDAWTELASGSSDVTIDLDQIIPDVLVRVDTELPEDTINDGFRLSAERRVFPLSGLAAGDKVYARSTGKTTSLIVARS